MNMKQTIITILFALVVMSGQAQVRCHVIGTVAGATTSVELRIYHDGTTQQIDDAVGNFENENPVFLQKTCFITEVV